jgi:hypothetical protein
VERAGFARAVGLRCDGGAARLFEVEAVVTDHDAPTPEPDPTARSEGSARRIRDLSLKQRRQAVAFAIARAVLVAVGVIVVYGLVPFDRSSTGDIFLVGLAAVVIIVLVNVFELRAVSLAEFPTLRAFEALSLSLVVVLVAFASMYLVLTNDNADAFDEALNHTGALYFSLTTLTTIGYGDIVPVSDTARKVVMAQMLIDVLVIGVFVRLVVNVVRARLPRSANHSG